MFQKKLASSTHTHTHTCVHTPLRRCFPDIYFSHSFQGGMGAALLSNPDKIESVSYCCADVYFVTLITVCCYWAENELMDVQVIGWPCSERDVIWIWDRVIPREECLCVHVCLLISFLKRLVVPLSSFCDHQRPPPLLLEILELLQMLPSCFLSSEHCQTASSFPEISVSKGLHAWLSQQSEQVLKHSY